MRASWCLAILLLAPVLPAATAHDGDDAHGPAVASDPAAAFFPTASEVQDALDDALSSRWGRVQALGAAESGAPLRLLVITDPDSPVPMGERVVTFLMTQQHGNEPAGTGAAIPLLRDILAGRHPADLLGNQVLLLLPMVNPDGAAANARENRNQVDINRDHVGLETKEARAVHEVLRSFDVHVAVDHHEYSGTGVGTPVPVRLYDYDLTTMYPRHGNVRQPTLDSAKALDYEGIWKAAQAAGYTVGDYGVQTIAGQPAPPETNGVLATAGGPDPGILRNNFGLNNIAGLLAETFISPQPENPFQSAERRMAIHRLVMETTLQWAHDHASALIAAKRESERLNLEEPMPDYVEGDLKGPLPKAFRVSTDVSGLFSLHAFPAGDPVAGGTVYSLKDARSGLVASILHPKSSRHVADATAAEPQPLATDQQAARSVPSLPLAFVVAALALALAARRPRPS
ncbi:MAG TPA: M14 family zinc carboxypeptidase [Candidatus Thermoplasmatota archaeon]|nr:M14 family zinc carboxypeptidase [Candidatus Thermoplasmatota archaeon]